MVEANPLPKQDKHLNWMDLYACKTMLYCINAWSPAELERALWLGKRLKRYPEYAATARRVICCIRQEQACRAAEEDAFNDLVAARWTSVGVDYAPLPGKAATTANVTLAAEQRTR